MSKREQTVADRLFAGRDAEREIENALDDAGFHYERIGWDDYDWSLEIHDVAPDDRLSPELATTLLSMGFLKVYVNHTDGWETHYNVGREPWRVSYPHKRGDGERGIWVEEKVDTWPSDWFDSGYAVVKS